MQTITETGVTFERLSRDLAGAMSEIATSDEATVVMGPKGEVILLSRAHFEKLATAYERQWLAQQLNEAIASAERGEAVPWEEAWARLSEKFRV